MSRKNSILYIKRNNNLINFVYTLSSLKKLIDEHDHYMTDKKRDINRIIEDDICGDIIRCDETNCVIFYNVGNSSFAITDIDHKWVNFDGDTIFAQYTLNNETKTFGLELNSNFTYILSDIPSEIIKRIERTIDYLIKHSKYFSKLIDDYISNESLYYNCKQFGCIKTYTFDLYEDSKLISPNITIELIRPDDTITNELESHLLYNGFINYNDDYGLTNTNTHNDTIFKFEISNGKVYTFKRH